MHGSSELGIRPPNPPSISVVWRATSRRSGARASGTPALDIVGASRCKGVRPPGAKDLAKPK